MQKRRLRLILIGLGVLAGVLALVFRRSQEPEYEGKRLSEWVLKYYRGPPHNEGGQEAEAIRHIGTNALPHLLKWIRYETPAWKLKLYGTINPVIRRFKPAWELTDEKKLEKMEAATDALIELGPKAACATGELFEMLAGSEASAFRALKILEGLGSAGLPPVAGVLTNKAIATTSRNDLGYYLGSLGTNGRAVLPALFDLLKNQDLSVREAAMKAIRGIDPEVLENDSVQ